MEPDRRQDKVAAARPDGGDGDGESDGVAGEQRDASSSRESRDPPAP